MVPKHLPESIVTESVNQGFRGFSKASKSMRALNWASVSPKGFFTTANLLGNFEAQLLFISNRKPCSMLRCSLSLFFVTLMRRSDCQGDMRVPVLLPGELDRQFCVFNCKSHVRRSRLRRSVSSETLLTPTAIHDTNAFWLIERGTVHQLI